MNSIIFFTARTPVPNEYFIIARLGNNLWSAQQLARTFYKTIPNSRYVFYYSSKSIAYRGAQQRSICSDFLLYAELGAADATPTRRTSIDLQVNDIPCLRIAWFLQSQIYLCHEMKQLLTPSHPSTSKTSRGSWRCATDVRKYSHNFFMLPDVSWQPVSPRPREPARGQEVNTWGPSRQLIMKCGSNRPGPQAGDARTQSRPLRIIPANSPPVAPPVSPPVSPRFLWRPWHSPGKCVGAERAKSSHISASTPRARGVTPGTSLALAAGTKLLIIEQFWSTLPTRGRLLTWTTTSQCYVHHFATVWPFR